MSCFVYYSLLSVRRAWKRCCLWSRVAALCPLENAGKAEVDGGGLRTLCALRQARVAPVALGTAARRRRPAGAAAWRGCCACLTRGTGRYVGGVAPDRAAQAPAVGGGPQRRGGQASPVDDCQPFNPCVALASALSLPPLPFSPSFSLAFDCARCGATSLELQHHRARAPCPTQLTHLSPTAPHHPLQLTERCTAALPDARVRPCTREELFWCAEACMTSREP